VEVVEEEAVAVEGAAALTVKVNVVVREREPPEPVTVIVDDPVGVDAAVVSVSVDEQVGLHDAGENEAVAPVGRPEAENETDCAVPETRLAVIVLETDCPWTTVLFPPLESENQRTPEVAAVAEVAPMRKV